MMKRLNAEDDITGLDTWKNMVVSEEVSMMESYENKYNEPFIPTRSEGKRCECLQIIVDQNQYHMSMQWMIHPIG
jgi:hypothetical protein